MSTLGEQTIPQTVCWAFMPIRLHHILFLNVICNSVITPPDRDKNTSGNLEHFSNSGCRRIASPHRVGAAHPALLTLLPVRPMLSLLPMSLQWAQLR